MALGQTQSIVSTYVLCSTVESGNGASATTPNCQSLQLFSNAGLFIGGAARCESLLERMWGRCSVTRAVEHGHMELFRTHSSSPFHTW